MRRPKSRQWPSKHAAHAAPCAVRAAQVKGFNVRSWMRDNRKKIPAMLEALGKLVAADKLSVRYTE